MIFIDYVIITLFYERVFIIIRLDHGIFWEKKHTGFINIRLKKGFGNSRDL